MMHKNTMYPQFKQAGFSLIELMIAVAIGLFLIAGALTVYVNTNDSQRMVEDQVAMMDEARFAMEVIGYDLRHAGNFGRMNEPELVDTSLITGLIANDCLPTGWAADATNWVYAYNDTTDDGVRNITGCTTGHITGDIIETRYALNTPIVALQPNKVYLNGDVNGSTYFTGAVAPDPGRQNYEAVANAYYIGSYSYAVGDNIPSLRRISIQPGPVVSDDMVLSGVENLQVMIGTDVDNDGTVDTYSDPSSAINWNWARSVQIWLVVRSNDLQPDIDTSANFTIAGQNVAYPNDGYRRFMISTVVSLRNSKPRIGG